MPRRSRAAIWKPRSARSVGGSFHNLPNERLEHRSLIHPVVVPERVLVKVHLQVLTRDVVIDAVDPALHERPEAFDGVRMHVAKDVDPHRVVDAPMLVAEPPQL